MLATLFLHFVHDYGKAEKMRSSDVRSIFESKAFSDWKKGQDATQKTDQAVVERLDVLIKAFGNLAKSVSR